MKNEVIINEGINVECISPCVEENDCCTNPSVLISSDLNNSIIKGTDGKLFSSGSGGGTSGTSGTSGVAFAAGSNTEIQFNDNGSFAGSPSLTWDGSILDVSGTTSLQYLKFDTNINPPVISNPEELTWNDTDGTLDLRLKGNNVTLQIGQENIIRVVNLPPRMTGDEVLAISTPAEGLMVYATSTSTNNNISNKGWWGYDGNSWIQIG
jgi:hypothetical protein